MVPIDGAGGNFVTYRTQVAAGTFRFGASISDKVTTGTFRWHLSLRQGTGYRLERTDYPLTVRLISQVAPPYRPPQVI